MIQFPALALLGQAQKTAAQEGRVYAAAGPGRKDAQGVSQERTEAVVLRGTDFSETSRIVTFLTPERGKVACMARGARRSKSGVAAALDTLSRLEMVYYWKDSREVQQLGEVSLLTGYPGIKTDLDKTTYAAFPAELVYRLAHANEPSEKFYAVFVQGLDSLDSWDGDVRTHCVWQAWRLLKAAGFEPAMGHCGGCGKALSRAAGFSRAVGAVCGTCPSDARLSQKLWAQWKAIGRAEEVCPEFALDREGFIWLARYAAYHIEQDLRSVRVIEELLG